MDETSRCSTDRVKKKIVTFFEEATAGLERTTKHNKKEPVEQMFFCVLAVSSCRLYFIIFI